MVLVFFSSCCVTLLACGGQTPAQDAGPPVWHVVLQKLKPALLCVWGTTANDVFAVGGPRGNGTPAAVLHYDGHAWNDLAPGGTETFWWAHGTSDKDVWVVGENGRISHWNGATFTEHVSGVTATLYGVWAMAPNDVWAVGGTPGGGTTVANDVVLHFDGSGWTPAPPPQALGRAFFKVWAATPDNLYVVGEAATIWHRTGGAWALEPNPGRGNLTTVTGCGATRVYAVGGRDVLVSDGMTWKRADVQLVNDVSGVACASLGSAVIVGSGGLKQRLVAGLWEDDSSKEPYGVDLHAAWADPAGAYWAAGGDYISYPSQGAARSGVVAYYGNGAPSGKLAP
jgi:hypothetical protein